MTKYGAEFLKA